MKLRLLQRPYYDPRTGEILTSIEGRRNRPGIDPFEGGGKVYPPIPEGLRVVSWQERGDMLMLLVEGEQADVDRLKAMSGKATYQASPKEVREYDLFEHAPVELDDTQALEALKRDIGLPEGTALDAESKPVVPEERRPASGPE